MKLRTTFLAGAAVLALLVTAGVGLADAPGGAPTTRSETVTAPTDNPTPVEATHALTVDASPAGAVHYAVTDVLTITRVDAAAGWTAEVEQARGHEIEVVFTNGSLRTDVEVELEHGAARERVRDRVTDDDACDEDRSGRGCDDARRAPDRDDRPGHALDDDDRDDRSRGAHPEDD